MQLDSVKMEVDIHEIVNDVIYRPLLAAQSGPTTPNAALT